MNVKISGGGLGTPFSSYKALYQPPLLQKDTPGSQKHDKSHYQKQAPTPPKPLLRDSLILEIYIDVQMVCFVNDSVFGFPFCSGPNFSMILSLKRKKTKGSQTLVTSGDCLDASDLNAFVFFAWVTFRFGYLTDVGMQRNPRCPICFFLISPTYFIVQACVFACLLAWSFLMLFHTFK